MLSYESNPPDRAWSDGVMWILIARPPRPDATSWPGRRLLAALDAVAWPALIAATFTLAPISTGVVGPTFVGILVLIAMARLQQALWRNERYWFTTWRWGKVMVALLVVGVVLKLSIPAAMADRRPGGNARHAESGQEAKACRGEETRDRLNQAGCR